MIPKRRKPAPLRLREDPQIRCPAHMQWVRLRFECAIADKGNHACTGRMHAHHAREGANGGMGLKPDDTTVVPLCDLAHAEIHNIGWRTFEQRYGVDLSEMAKKLAAASPHRSKWADRQSRERVG